MEEVKKIKGSVVPIAPVKKTLDFKVKKEEPKKTCYDSVTR
jgi:hypothetical protein